ncbi:hypothetical protein C5Z03_06740 [Bacteroides thetaiotaomicron]|jgi:hypothetical protein|uniref:Uncharacterized protein n=2 Tax=Bacteroides thetaiotaomicron TaxID=818 RepID=Q8A567_BACTN|nr:hypothetical protein BT_2375 [Bacteroides thetaiotaomicron VPI-5482]KAB4447824.1 hypothetical protein GAN55_02445 [Bacteroides thetaiotaomicron]KAB4476521.1 hypothetical protein GAN91_20880 [Bacteroides thetaiotaomicron]KAB4522343.1 hypothetical protein GAO00_00615 [Bacteroides thetaiotaomicron]PQL45501.1 hypothetical protein C5Z03_06740 [Bacteroides thetaiotaomicron]
MFFTYILFIETNVSKIFGIYLLHAKAIIFFPASIQQITTSPYLQKQMTYLKYLNIYPEFISSF